MPEQNARIEGIPGFLDFDPGALEEDQQYAIIGD